jgi:hypothetical protein
MFALQINGITPFKLQLSPLSPETPAIYRRAEFLNRQN